MRYRKWLRALGSAGLIVGAILLMGGAPARADVRYTTQMTVGDSAAAKPADAQGDSPAPGGMPLMRMTTWVKDMRQRQEMNVQTGPVKMRTVTLTSCDSFDSTKIDPDLKIYTVEAMGGMSGMPSTGRRSQPMPPQAKPGVGKVIMTYDIQSLGKEEFPQFKLTASHYMMTTHMQTSGCIGEADTTMKMEIWVAPVKGGLDCPNRFAPTQTQTDANGCKITYETHGNVGDMHSIFGGLIVREKIYQGDKVVMTQELREYSLDQLDDSLFTVPADYKKVSDDEFNKAEQQAMMKAMMGGGAGAPPADSDNAKPASGSDTPADSGQPKPDDSATPDKPKKKKIKIPHLPF